VGILSGKDVNSAGDSKRSDVMKDNKKGEYMEIRIIVELSDHDATHRELLESAKKSVGRYTAHRHPSHTGGIEIHGHCQIAGGNEVSWTVSGKRHHPKKFPADNKIPKDAKAAVADVLGVNVDLLESFITCDEEEKREVYILKKKSYSQMVNDILLKNTP
jgi:hypothetical protein